MSDTFNVDSWSNEARRTPFVFTLNGTDFALPSAGGLDKKIIRAVSLTNPSPDDIEILLKAGLGERWAEFDEQPMRLDAVGELFRRWQNHEGVSLGESEASTDS